MKSFFTIVPFLFLCQTVLGTAQIPDKILYNKKEYMLQSNPLEVFFEEYPEKRPKSQVWSNALYRGYVATFQIRNNQLYVRDIEIIDNTGKSGWKSVKKNIFPRRRLVKVDWMTGLLVLPSGKLLSYVDRGYASTFERYTVLEINNGTLVSEKQFEYAEFEIFKEQMFELFKKTEEYQRQKSRLQRNTEWSDDEIDIFLKNIVLEFSK